MTEEELDQRIRALLLETIRLEWGDMPQDTPLPAPSPRHQRQLRAMTDDPWGWYRRRIRPVWKRVLHTAATILLTCSIALGAVMAVSPTVRAVVVQWVREWYESILLYRYAGPENPEGLPQYTISELPDGYTETERFVTPSYVNVTYQNNQGQLFYLNYVFIQEGNTNIYHTDSMGITSVTVNGCVGQLFRSQEAAQTSFLTWVDEARQLQFTLDGFVDSTVLLHMAERLILCDSTK